MEDLLKDPETAELLSRSRIVGDRS